jgi:VanZ family protein
MLAQSVRTLWRLLFLAGTVVILVLALAPLPAQELTGWDKTHHVLAFFTLAMLGWLGWPAALGRVIVGLALYGLAIEGLQALTPDRVPDWRDVVANTCGLAAAWLVLKVRTSAAT